MIHGDSQPAGPCDVTDVADVYRWLVKTRRGRVKLRLGGPMGMTYHDTTTVRKVVAKKSRVLRKCFVQTPTRLCRFTFSSSS